MFRYLLYLCVFLAGLAVVGWIGVGCVGSNPLGALVALAIGAGYLAGAFELHGYRQATSTLQHALTDLSSAPASLCEWLGRMHPSLRNAVRLRIEGERVALPAPALTPSLVGLLVLLGMLGTLLGMMVTLRGTGMALENATDLQSIRADLQTALASHDEERLVTWSQTLGSMTAALGKQWEHEGEQAAARQRAICDTLAQTVGDSAARTQAHASETLAEISRLVDAAAEAPRVAAEVVGELRQKLSDSMVRDTAMLEARSRLLATLETLLDAVNHASTEQRMAVDALITTSANLLDRVSNRFADRIEAETGKLGMLSAQITGSAVELASLGEAFGTGVELFGKSNEALMERLQHIATALDASATRSDEQLEYYLAQAKEVIDLSVLSQKQIIEDLQQLAERRGSAGIEAA